MPPGKLGKSQELGADRQTLQLPLKLRNRFQVLTEKGDSGDEAESKQENSPPMPGKAQGTSPHLPTSTHTGSRVKVDGGESLSKVLHIGVADSPEGLRRP